ncbi:peptide chain release factor N(5)-glutamine methyltransferase [Mesonia sp. K7]|uniref:peptide chain release factor N(5)-glutamine methyltransferase n=1 Tax=Mesonia sp. K7 TaxID=2218606 RepID=UPI000DAA1880|nr:peptide chain release factor N(5)-glutamine methyltransferase [Mesonia sp. K7]PZD79575.1 peptide chain release factor N(5)-glutamine methyltransferase [Mesonia sp. K7]
MQIQQLKKYFFEELQAVFPETEINTFYHWLLEDFLQMKPVDAILNKTQRLTEEEEKQFKSAVERLKKQEPIQYILGKTEFYGYEFTVNPSVLIPRPETEELVDWIIKDHQGEKHLQVVDFCTGSACIAVSLSKNLWQSQVTAVDVSPQALEVAQVNAKNLAAEINFIESDVLQLDDFPKNQYDVIVSNPPYVRNLEKVEIKPNVLKYEPEIALFVADEDPLVFYQKITEIAKTSLKSGGSLYFEINQYLAEETKALVEQIGFTKVTLKKDIFNNFRMLKATR